MSMAASVSVATDGSVGTDAVWPRAQVVSLAMPAKPPPKRNVKGGRVTPKRDSASVSHPQASTRYTPPIPKSFKVSPPWVPVLMFSFLGLGLVLIFLNYLGLLPALWWTNPPDSDTSNWWLLIGLGCILSGITTATQYR